MLGAPEKPFGLGRRALPLRGPSQGSVDFLVRNGYRLGTGDGIQEQVTLDAPLGHRPVFVAEAVLLLGGPLLAFSP